MFAPLDAIRTLTALFSGPRLHLLPPRTDDPASPSPPDTRWPALLGLLIALLLVLGGILLIRELGRAGRLQDCVMSGRTNCAPIDPASVGGRSERSELSSNRHTTMVYSALSH